MLDIYPADREVIPRGHVQDVWRRFEELRASLTSTFGSILKIASTKKICRKLQGHAAGTVAWVTSVGNERGEIVQCILTTSEGRGALQELAYNLMQRYERAQEPMVIYTDTDCCGADRESKLRSLFSRWTELNVRLNE